LAFIQVHFLLTETESPLFLFVLFIYCGYLKCFPFSVLNSL